MTARRWRPATRTGFDRRALALAAAAGVVLLVGGTAITDAAFTDAAEADLGNLGGAYDIAFLDTTGTVVQGNPDPYVIDTVVPGPGGAPAVEADVVTTTPATGPVVLTLLNLRPEPLPPDPGVDGPGAEPYDVALFTVAVDGEPVVTDHDPDDGPVALPGEWTQGVARRVQVSVTLETALGNPYYYGRAMVLGLQFDGSTS
ncbi:hypothetical protein [Cellulosimicrobium cellulans]|uniref:hypothetical protein n=1 Tax=Cellulosimicrobium cellulans TaxID=1710 RepID=UPI00130ED321|nr:hypothetical protein [Cellulosimicrobium cellulans]